MAPGEGSLAAGVSGPQDTPRPVANVHEYPGPVASRGGDGGGARLHAGPGGVPMTWAEGESAVRIVVGVTGASGAIYGYSLIRTLADLGAQLDIIVTRMGEQVLAFECGVKKRELAAYGKIWANDNMFAPVASGTCLTAGMVIMPCSMNSLGAMANGVGDTLLYRTASVHLKERRPLIVVPRETPLHLIHLQNMERLALAGAQIMPASPGFYQRPSEIWELANFMVARVLDSLRIEHDLLERWGTHTAPGTE